jgi:hypothetical protein
LVDLHGDDEYQSGNFSQGGGYFFSFGLLYDGQGKDRNVGVRYSQGFGVHQAVGMRWDAAGDDTYATRCAANLGAAWDEGVGWFVEDGGNDHYESGGLALGGAAQTAFACFLDRAGDDVYRCAGGEDSLGGAGGSEYHDKASFGVCLELGGGKDDYATSARADLQCSTRPGRGLFLDCKERRLSEILERLEKSPHRNDGSK